MNSKNKVIIMTLGSVLSSGCASAINNIGYPTSNYDKIFPEETIEKIVEPSTKIDIRLIMKEKNQPPVNLKGSCSGTIICGRDRNYVYTAAHCVPMEADYGNLATYDRRLIVKNYETKVIKTDYSLKIDMALLELPAEENKKLPCFDGNLAQNVRLGDILGAHTYPGGGFRNENGALVRGHVAGFDGNRKDYFSGERIWTVFEGHIDFGSSGAGLFVFKKGEIYLASNVQVKYIKNKEGLKGMGPVWQTREFFKGTPLEKKLLGTGSLKKKILMK